jgi:hypothetical protein
VIQDPTNVFEQVQNEIAAELITRAPFVGLKMPDGSDFQILTEDEGEPEFLFTKMISDCGLSVVVQDPTGKLDISQEDGRTMLKFNPLVFAVSVSEMIIFNRGDMGTKVRISTAKRSILGLHGFVPAALGEKIFATQMLKDTTTHPDTGALVASRIVIFEVTELLLNIPPEHIT